MSSESDKTNLKRAKRRRQILGVTLKLVRKHGTGISTTQIAAASNCSKETLYNWFGDRDGIFLALIDEQARSMGVALDNAVATLDRELKTTPTFQQNVLHHAIALLDIMTGDAVIAVNRIAMSQTCDKNSIPGEAVMTSWESEVLSRFENLFSKGTETGDIVRADPKSQFDVLLGLLLGDRPRRLLLGESARPGNDEMRSIAQQAVQNWLKLNAA